MGGSARPLHPGAGRAQRGYPHPDPRQDIGAAPPALALDERLLVLVAEQVGRAVHQRAHLRAVQPRQLLRGVGGERHAEGARTPACARASPPGRSRRSAPDRGRPPGWPAGRGRSRRPRSSRPGRTRRSGCRRASVVQTKRAVCWRVDSRTPPQSTPCCAEPVAVRAEIRADRADQQRPEPEHAQAERDVRGHPAAPDLQPVNEEGQRYPVHLVGDELLDETAGERHEVIGRDRPGDGYAHGGTLGDGRTRPHCGPPQGRPAGSVTATGRSGGRPGRRGPLQWNESPQAQDPVAFGLSIVKPCFSIVSTKSMVAPHEVRGAHLVGDHVHAVELGVDVAVDLALVEVELVTQARAAARLDSDAKPQVVAALGGQQSCSPWPPRYR